MKEYSYVFPNICIEVINFQGERKIKEELYKSPGPTSF